jgi:DNA-binding NarL/FixJ family response regulator
VERAGLAALLAGSASVVVVNAGERSSDLAAIASQDVDVVVMSLLSERDLTIPLDLMPDLAHRAPVFVVLLDSPPPSPLWIAEAFGRGVVAVLPRDVSADELLAAVQAAAAGLVTLTRESAAAFAPPVRSTRSALVDGLEPLTPRELEILGLLADGLANKEIAARLQISSHTVKTHVQSVFTKLGAETRTEAVALGVRRGLILL